MGYAYLGFAVLRVNLPARRDDELAPAAAHVVDERLPDLGAGLGHGGNPSFRIVSPASGSFIDSPSGVDRQPGKLSS